MCGDIATDERSPSTVKPAFLRSVGRVNQRLYAVRPICIWLLILVLWLGVAAWAYLDPHFEFKTIIAGVSELSGREVSLEDAELYNLPMQLENIALVMGISTILVCCFVHLGSGLWKGSKQYRSLKSLLMFVTLACLWVGLIVSLPNIAWYGKQARVARLLDQFEPIVAELQADWPIDDGKLPTLGPFMAYPIGQPVTLVLLTPPVLRPSGTMISLVERSKNGGLRFHLSGSEMGDWLEFHPTGQQPDSFQGGLEQSFELTRKKELDGNWFLVRYQLRTAS